jgi:LAO/AO transport system kinase
MTDTPGDADDGPTDDAHSDDDSADGDDSLGDDPLDGDPLDDDPLDSDDRALVSEVLAGDQRALARVLSKIEDRTPGYRAILSALYEHTGSTPVLGVTGSPGAGKSTLVDALTRQYREADDTVGVLAVDPSSPYTGGSVLGDRIRMGSTAGDPGVFIRSMSARGSLGGLSMATADAVVALDAFGLDRIVIETVGAGQNEVDVVETADTVAVVVQPGSGDDVQLLKAGILEIGDLFVVNKADMDEAAGTVADLEEMIHLRSPPGAGRAGGSTGTGGHHGAGVGSPSTRATDAASTDVDTADAVSNTADVDTDGTNPDSDGTSAHWTPPVLETVATTGLGVADLREAIDDHQRHLDRAGGADERRRRRAAATLQRLLQRDLGSLSERLVAARGGLDTLAAAVASRETDPYTVVEDLVGPIEAALRDTDESVDSDERLDTDESVDSDG